METPTRSPPFPALVKRLDLKGALVPDRRHGVQSHQLAVDASEGRLPSGRQGQSADPPCRYRKLFEPRHLSRSRRSTVGKDRLEVRNHSVSHKVDWYAAERSYPGAPRFPKLTTIAMRCESRIERGDKIETERRSYISSRVLSAAAFWGSGTQATGPSKQPPLEPRHHLRRGPVTPAHRPQCQEHGRRSPLRSRSWCTSRRQTINQATHHSAWDPQSSCKLWGSECNLNSLP